MGIVETELAIFELSDGQECRVELNADETIHIHVGNVRIDMSPDEFRHFASTVTDARETLHETKEW